MKYSTEWPISAFKQLFWPGKLSIYYVLLATNFAGRGITPIQWYEPQGQTVQNLNARSFKTKT